jgi:hypothetical protein
MSSTSMKTPATTAASVHHLRAMRGGPFVCFRQMTASHNNISQPNYQSANLSVFLLPSMT